MESESRRRFGTRPDRSATVQLPPLIIEEPLVLFLYTIRQTLRALKTWLSGSDSWSNLPTLISSFYSLVTRPIWRTGVKSARKMLRSTQTNTNLRLLRRRHLTALMSTSPLTALSTRYTELSPRTMLMIQWIKTYKHPLIVPIHRIRIRKPPSSHQY